MNLQKTQFLKRWSLLLLIPLMVLTHNVTNAFAQSAETNKSPQQAKGPNGGKILSDGNVTLELAIFERGVPPEYRAWITQDGKPVKDFGRFLISRNAVCLSPVQTDTRQIGISSIIAKANRN